MMTSPTPSSSGLRTRRRARTASVRIGGFVRDLLDRPCKDIDIVTEGSGIELARHRPIHGHTPSPCLQELRHRHVQGARLRSGIRRGAERKLLRGRKTRRRRCTLEDDQNRRDFTINAMAISLNAYSFGKLVDLFGGVDDLNRKWIRTLIPT